MSKTTNPIFFLCVPVQIRLFGRGARLKAKIEGRRSSSRASHSCSQNPLSATPPSSSRTPLPGGLSGNRASGTHPRWDLNLQTRRASQPRKREEYAERRGVGPGRASRAQPFPLRGRNLRTWPGLLRETLELRLAHGPAGWRDARLGPSSLLPLDALRSRLRPQGGSLRVCALGKTGGADGVAFPTHRAAGKQKARARGSVWSRICALGGDRARSGVPAEGLHFPEGSGTSVPVLGVGASVERGRENCRPSVPSLR